jgi:hypothetical protein
MNIREEKSTMVEITTSEDIARNDNRKKLLIQAQGGVVYLKFSSAAEDSNVPDTDDYHLKLADNEWIVLPNYLGPCRAKSGNLLNYTEFF